MMTMQNLELFRKIRMKRKVILTLKIQSIVVARMLDQDLEDTGLNLPSDKVAHQVTWASDCFSASQGYCWVNKMEEQRMKPLWVPIEEKSRAKIKYLNKNNILKMYHLHSFLKGIKHLKFAHYSIYNIALLWSEICKIS